MKKILGIGNALVDLLIQLDNDDFLIKNNLPKGGMQLVDQETSHKIIEATALYPKNQASGGSSANTIHGLAKLNIQTGYIGTVGNDAFGTFFKQDLIDAQISPTLFDSTTPSGKAITLISKDSERTFATYLGAALELSANSIKEEMFNGYAVFHAEGYLVYNNELLEHCFKIAKSKGLLVSLDLSAVSVINDNKKFLERLVKEYVDIVFANEEEAKAYTGLEPEEALDEISKECTYAIVKVGKKGSFIKYNGVKTQVGIIEVNAIDTTGAGDLYAAGFLYGLSKNLSMDKCGKIGALLSGNVVENLGAKIDTQKWETIKKRITEIEA